MSPVPDSAREPRPAPDSDEFPAWLRRALKRADFEGLPADDVEAMAPFGAPCSFDAGAVLFRQREQPEAVFIIVRGEVDLVHAVAGRRRIVQIVRSGYSVGDLPVMLNMPNAYTAITRTRTTALRFSMETIRALVEVYPEVCFRWLRLVSRRLERAERRLVELEGRSALEQIVGFLLHEADDRDSHRVRITQGDIAASLGLGRQTVSRILGELERQALLLRGRGEVSILDRAKLSQLHAPDH